MQGQIIRVLIEIKHLVGNSRHLVGMEMANKGLKIKI